MKNFVYDFIKDHKVVLWLMGILICFVIIGSAFELDTKWFGYPRKNNVSVNPKG